MTVLTCRREDSTSPGTLIKTRQAFLGMSTQPYKMLDSETNASCMTLDGATQVKFPKLWKGGKERLHSSGREEHWR